MVQLFLKLILNFYQRTNSLSSFTLVISPIYAVNCGKFIFTLYTFIQLTPTPKSHTVL